MAERPPSAAWFVVWHHLLTAARLLQWRIAGLLRRQPGCHLRQAISDVAVLRASGLFDHHTYRRNYPEVARRFPDPLWHYVLQGGHDGFDPHPLFASAWYLQQNPAVARLGLNPLAHFVRTGAAEGCRPHPLFDADYYLRNNPDVRASGWNPLLHYVHCGEAENRMPNPNFDPAYVRARWPEAGRDGTLLLVAAQGGGLDRTHPRYEEARDHIRLAERRQRMVPGRPVALSIAHCGSGGTGNSVARKMRLTDGSVYNLLANSFPTGRTVLRQPADHTAPEIIFDLHSTLADRIAVIRQLGVQHIHVHHLMYNEHWLPAFLRATNLPYDITLHDYHLLAPRAHLTDEAGRFVGDERLHDEILARPLWANAPRHTLAEWRALCHPLLQNAQRILAPSRDLARRFRLLYPDLNILVVPHHEEERPEPLPVQRIPCAVGEPMRVLLLGTLMANKGSRVLAEGAALAARQQAPLEFHILGAAEVEQPIPGVTFHGAYEIDQLFSKLRAVHPHLAWFPSQCPESYSYTLSEAMQASLPILAADLGSLPERLGGRPWTWLHPWSATPAQWVDRLLEIRTRHVVGAEPAQAPGHPPTWDIDYYPARYLEGLPKK